jgi:molecular chaperone GrpE
MTERPFEEDATLDGDVGAEAATESGTSTGAPLVEPAASAVGRLEEQLQQAREQHLRLAADFDNFRKRIARERIELSDRAQAAFVIRLLDVLDDLDRLAATDPAASRETLRPAIELVDRKLRKELELAGLERVDPVGKPFDPAVAEAVSVLAPPTPDQDHQVASTFQVGYRFKGALVRPARVQVYSAEGNA